MDTNRSTLSQTFQMTVGGGEGGSTLNRTLFSSKKQNLLLENGRLCGHKFTSYKYVDLEYFKQETESVVGKWALMWP